jgi:hypothetical protein
VKKVFIRSGIRFDYLINDKDDTFIHELCEHHVSGQLKVAPEHISDKVLNLMGKPENAVYERFIKKYKKTNEEVGKKQFVVPYLMSSHPGSTLKEAIELAEYLRDLGYMPEQVQDFYPTPSTISTCMYYTGLDPRTMQPVYVPKTPHDKAMQRALIQYRNPKNYDLVVEALTLAHRADLIGFDKKCLIRPKHNYDKNYGSHSKDDKKDSRNHRDDKKDSNTKKESRYSKLDKKDSRISDKNSMGAGKKNGAGKFSGNTKSTDTITGRSASKSTGNRNTDKSTGARNSGKLNTRHSAPGKSTVKSGNRNSNSKRK